MKSQFSITKAVSAGVAGTIVMTLFTYMGGLMNIKMDIPAMLASVLGGNLIFGWVMHFMIGIVLSINFAMIFYPITKINPQWLRGAIFGIIPWLMAQIIVMPIMSVMNGMSFSAGLFSGSMMMAFASLVGHLIYGAVIGVI